MPAETSLSVEDFDAAKSVFEQLKDLPRERQERVLRWISEGLGIAPASTAPVPVPGVAAAPPASLTPAVPLSGSPGIAGKDIKSFVAEKDPKTDNQFAAVVAYFYRFEAPPAQRTDSIDSNVLQEAARLAGRKRLAEPRYALNNAKNAGYLDSAERGQFSINSVGENLVAMALPGNSPASSASKRGKKRGSAGARKKSGASKKRR